MQHMTDNTQTLHVTINHRPPLCHHHYHHRRHHRHHHHHHHRCPMSSSLIHPQSALILLAFILLFPSPIHFPPSPILFSNPLSFLFSAAYEARLEGPTLEQLHLHWFATLCGWCNRKHGRAIRSLNCARPPPHSGAE
jgi:hypothetical protein